MDKQKTYIISLSFTYLVMTIILVIFNENRLNVYMSLFIIGYFSITTLFNPRKNYIDIVGIGLFILFSYIFMIIVLDYWL